MQSSVDGVNQVAQNNARQLDRAMKEINRYPQLFWWQSYIKNVKFVRYFWF